jgi:hypothetical protein
MRAVVIGIVLVVLAGCGGEEPAERAAVAPEATPAAPAKELVYLYRVQGDDPTPDSVTLREDGSVLVTRGGGHSGIKNENVDLSQAAFDRTVRLAASAPWKALDGRTVTPGGFGGWDNDMRYMLRRGQRSITVTDADMPRSLRPLVHQLDAIIEGDVGTITDTKMRSSISGTIEN